MKFSFRNELPRVYELKDMLVDSSHPDAYFQNFEKGLLETTSKLNAFRKLERWLDVLDDAAWQDLRQRAAPLLLKRESGRGWQKLFDILHSEARAFVYLQSICCTGVHFIAPPVSPVLVRGKVSQTPTPFPTPLSPLNPAGPTRVFVCSVERIRGEGHYVAAGDEVVRVGTNIGADNQNLRHGISQGLVTSTPKPSKSSTFLVATERSWAFAVTARFTVPVQAPPRSPPPAQSHSAFPELHTLSRFQVCVGQVHGSFSCS